jgi:glycosyltransferase involved in cell wall biosynthesis
MKTVIAIPNSRTIEIETAASLIGMTRKGRIAVFAPANYCIDASRNIIVDYALENNADYIFWCDSDMIVPKDALIKFLASGKDIICGACSYKVLGCKDAVAKRKIDGGYKDIPLKEVREAKNLIELDATGFGCVLTKVDVFRKLPKPWFVYKPDFGEDIYFSELAKEHGYQLWLDPSVRLGHIGKVNYNV